MNVFKYFLECYLAISYTHAHDALPGEAPFDVLLRKFKTQESSKIKKLFCSELAGIEIAGNYEKFVPYVNKHGAKSMNAQDVEELVKDLLEALSENTLPIELSRNHATLDAFFKHNDKKEIDTFLEKLRRQLPGIVIWLESSEFPPNTQTGTCHFKLRSEHGKSLSLLTIAHAITSNFKHISVEESTITELLLSQTSGDLPKNSPLSSVHIQLL